jgi:hypothetical protein
MRQQTFAVFLIVLLVAAASPSVAGTNAERVGDVPPGLEFQHQLRTPGHRPGVLFLARNRKNGDPG